MARYGRDGYVGIGDMTVGDYANGMPNIRIGEMFKSLMRQIPWMVILFVIGAVPAWYFTKDIERTYEGTGRLLIQQGEEHTFNDISGNSAGAVLQGPDSITHAEVAIIKNNEVIDRVIGEMVSKHGESKFNKEAFDKINAARRSGDSVALNNARVDLQKSIDSAFWVTPRPKTGVIDMGFKHEDAEIAKDTLNSFIDNYLSFRRTIFVEGNVDVFRKRRISTSEQLQEVESNIQSFLRRNGISDFDSERAGATERTEDLRAELNTLRSQMSETEAALATVEGQLRATPIEINLTKTDIGAQRVAQAELELKQLLAKYLPNSDPVRLKQAEIAELKSLQQTYNGQSIGGRTVGPNPTYQALMTQRNTLQARADSFREKEFTLQRLLNAADAKVKKLQRLSPEYSNMLRERATLDQRLTGYTNKEQEALVNQEQAEAANSENVKVINYATLPRKGRNMSKIMFALIMLAWGFTLFMFALLRVFLDPRLYSDPTRRMRPQRRYMDDYEEEDYGRDVPVRAPVQPYIPEPVPVQPAAAQYGSYQAATPMADYNQANYAPRHNQMSSTYQAVPYAPNSNAAYDMSANPYGVQQTGPVAPGFQQLPSSELD